MTQGYSGTAQISGYFNSILEDAVFVAREAMIMPGLVTQYTGEGWADRKLSVYPQISAASVGETEDYANPTVFDKSAMATLTPGEIMAQSILTKRRLETDPQNARTDCANELGNAISDKIEQDLLDLFSSFTDSHGAGANNAFTLASVANAASSLRVAKARGPYFVVIHPFQWLDVWNEIGKPSTTNVIPNDIASAAMRDYFVASLIQAQWFQHSMITVDGSDDATGAIFNREALALDLRRAPNLEPEYDASKRAWELNMNAGYAKGVRRNAMGCKLISDATSP